MTQREGEIKLGEETIVMVFLHKSADANLRLIRRYLKEGLYLYAMNRDKAYFRKADQ